MTGGREGGREKDVGTENEEREGGKEQARGRRVSERRYPRETKTHRSEDNDKAEIEEKEGK